jgi:hypothetical protein
MLQTEYVTRKDTHFAKFGMVKEVAIRKVEAGPSRTSISP